eukprot:3005266-Rhodomonas_salina.3
MGCLGLTRVLRAARDAGDAGCDPYRPRAREPGGLGAAVSGGEGGRTQAVRCPYLRVFEWFCWTSVPLHDGWPA